MKLITAKIFDNPIDAHLLKTKLESEGVSCYLFDEHTISINPLYSNAVGGIKLKILDTDIERTREILNRIEKTPLTNDDNVIIKCPNCDSHNIYSGFKSMKGLKGTLSIILSFLFMIFPIYHKTVFKCKDCNTEFKN